LPIWIEIKCVLIVSSAHTTVRMAAYTVTRPHHDRGDSTGGPALVVDPAYLATAIH